MAEMSPTPAPASLRRSTPWVFGFTFSPSPLQYEPLTYHPIQKTMQVAANTVLAELDTTG